MEIFQTIWTALTTPNEELVQIIGIPFSFIEAYVYMLLFTTILNISSTKKQQFLYVFSFSIIGIFINSFIPKIYCGFLLMIIYPILIMLIFKTNLLKAIVAEILPLLISSLLEILISKIYLVCFDTPYDIAVSIPIYRESIVLLVYFCIFLTYKLSKHYNFNITLIDNMDKKNKTLLIVNLIIGIIAICIQLFLSNFYNENLPVIITLFSILTLIAYFLTSLFTLTRITQLQITTQSLEEAQLYNKSLKILHDNVRAFKHDFSNIVQAIGRVCRN